MRTAIFIGFICNPAFIFAQKFSTHSIIITKSKDSIHVLTKNKELINAASVTVLDSASGKYLTYLASDIEGIIIGDEDFYKGAIVKMDHTGYNEEIDPASYSPKESIDTVFLKSEYESNVLRLYSFNDKNRTHLFVQKANGQIEELIYRKLVVRRDGTAFETEEKKYIEQLDDLLADCPSVASSLNYYISYTPQAIEKVFEKYATSCHKESVTRYVKHYNSTFDFAGLIGGSLIAFDYEESGGYSSNGVKMSSGFSPVIGIRFDYSPAILANKLAFVADVYYNQYSAKGSYYSNYVNDSVYTRNSLQLKNSYADMALAVRYYFANNRKVLRPFINLGPLFGFRLASDNKMSTEEFLNGSQYNSEAEAFPGGGMKDMLFGIFVGAGIKYSRFSLEYRYFKYAETLNYAYRKLSSTSNNITLTYIFNK